MLRSVISKVGPSHRIAVLASAYTLGTLALIGTASTAGIAKTPSCSNATLKGTYVFGFTSWTILAGKAEPVALGGFDIFDGAGTGTGVITLNSNGVVVYNNLPSTSTYTIKSDCTGTIVFKDGKSLVHDNVYLSPSGDEFTSVGTDKGSVSATTEVRVAP
jgi:hypothetical protein